uniref:Histone 2A-domain-containing protein n=1 Tax=Marseillevirus LCMAC202 TaxID=2506606 RepID=A0A481Z033_9VIRU|nr:MAG: histone 2A-domain-containing protein [Marseillevirus LCMAC202]
MNSKVPKKKVRSYDNLHTFIYRLLKHYDPKANMTAECKDILNHLIRDLSLHYITACVELCRYAKKVTIDSNAIETLTNIWITNPDYLIDFAHDTWDVYSQNTTKGIKKSCRAGLFLPPARFRELFREYRGANQKIGEPAYIFLTAVIEAIFGLIIERAVHLARDEHKITVSGLHIYNAINSKDFSHLYPLWNNSFIAGFGYIGNTLLQNAQERYIERKQNDREVTPDTAINKIKIFNYKLNL